MSIFKIMKNHRRQWLIHWFIQQILINCLFWLKEVNKVELVLDFKEFKIWACCCCSVAQSCSTLCYPMDCIMSGFSVLHYLLKFFQTHVCWVGDAIQPSHPLLLLPSTLPSIRIFSREWAVHIRWPKYWSFRFSISPSNEYSWLISFRIDWFDLLAVQGTWAMGHHNLGHESS